MQATVQDLSRHFASRRRRLGVYAWLALTASAAVSSAAFLFGARSLEPLQPLKAQQPNFILRPRTRMVFPDKALSIEIKRRPDEIGAYHELAALRAREAATKFLLTFTSSGDLVLRSELSQDLLAAIATVEHLRVKGVVNGSGWAVTDLQVLGLWRDQSRLFEQAYAGLPEPHTNSGRPAGTIVADILEVSAFFDLPPSAFLLDEKSLAGSPRATWQDHPDTKQVILARSKAKYLTLPRQSVKWEQTHAALQNAHNLYAADGRDYTKLPARLRPSRELGDEASPGALLVYAGLLLSDLAHKTPVPEAHRRGLLTIPDDPSIRQPIGVRRASLQATQVLVHALEVNRQKLLEAWESSSGPR